jgi:ATP-binding cassette, subfamily C (CFTR/MRP), member 1
MDESQSAAVLSARLDQAWTRRVEAANTWNDRLEKGEIRPSLSMKLRWTLYGLVRRGYAFRNEVEAAERHWRSVSGRKNPSLAWSMNDVFWRGFWIGGVFKVRRNFTSMI